MATSPEQVAAPGEARDVRPYDEPERLRKHHVTRRSRKRAQWILMHRERVVERKEIIELG